MLELSKDGDVVPLIGANVYWEGTNIGATTDLQGDFSIDEATSFPAILSVSYVGYTFDSKEIINDKYILCISVILFAKTKKLYFSNKFSNSFKDISSNITISCSLGFLKIIFFLHNSWALNKKRFHISFR